MKDIIITLTPPIDGVQYGYNSEPIKYGDWYISNIETIEQAPFNFKEGLRKVICSTNPKDLRFPFLVMPSKEQEVWKLAEEAASKNNITLYDSFWKKGFFIGFNANKGIYTQEQMEKAFNAGAKREWWLTGNTTECAELPDFDKFLQSIQPTAKAVRVEMEDNGSEEWLGSDADDEPFWVEKLEIKVETSSEYSQGIVRAIEVIY